MSRKLISIILLIVLAMCVMGTSCTRSSTEDSAADVVSSPDQLRVPREYDYRDQYTPMGYTTDGIYRNIAFCESFFAGIKEYYTDEAVIAMQEYNDYYSREHLPTDSNGNACLTEKTLMIYSYDADLIAGISLDESLGYMYNCPSITIDSDEDIHVIAEVRQLNVDDYEYYDFKFSSDGTLISTLPLQLDSNYKISEVEISGDGNIVILAQDSNWMGVLMEFDANGNLLYTETNSAGNCAKIICINGNVYVVLNRYVDDDTGIVSILSPVESIFDGEMDMTIALDSYQSYFAPYGDGFLYYDEMTCQIKYYDIATSEVSMVFDNSNNNGLFGVSDFYMNSSNEIISITTNGIDYNYYLCTYIPLEDGDVDNREVLVVGGVGISNDPIITNMVFRFNMEHEDYRMEIYDYASSEISTDDESLVTEFFFQMNDGEAPDILVDLPFDSIYGVDYLVDLNPYMSSDLNLDEYNSTLINLNQENYYVPATYSILGLLTFEDDISRMSSYSDFYELDSMYSGNQYSAILANISKEALLNTMLQVNWDRFFDTTSHTVSFDTDEFRELLQWVDYVGDTNVFMEDGDISSSFLTNGYTMYEYYSYLDKMNILMLEQYEFERDVNFVGLPTNDNSVYGFVPNYNFAITQNCSDPDVAWDFIRIVLSYDMQCVFSRVGFAVNNAANEDTFIETCHNYYVNGSLEIEDIDSQYAYLESILYAENTTITRYDPQLFAIINESSSGYFDGTRDIYEVTGIIQDQAETIMAERY